MLYSVKVYHQLQQPTVDPRLPQPKARPGETAVTPKLEQTVEALTEESACLRVLKQHQEYNNPSYTAIAVKLH